MTGPCSCRLLIAILCGFAVSGFSTPPVGNSSKKVVIEVRDENGSPIDSARIEMRTVYARKETSCSGLAQSNGIYFVELPLAIIEMPLRLTVERDGFSRFEKVAFWGAQGKANVRLKSAPAPPPSTVVKTTPPPGPMFRLDVQTLRGRILEPVTITWALLDPLRDQKEGLEVRFKLDLTKGTKPSRGGPNTAWSSWRKAKDGKVQFDTLGLEGKYRFTIQRRAISTKNEFEPQSVDFVLSWEYPDLLKNDFALDLERVRSAPDPKSTNTILAEECRKMYEAWSNQADSALKVLGVASRTEHLAPSLAGRIATGELSGILQRLALQPGPVTAQSLANTLKAKQIAGLLAGEHGPDLVRLCRSETANRSTTMAAISYFAWKYYEGRTGEPEIAGRVEAPTPSAESPEAPAAEKPSVESPATGIPLTDPSRSGKIIGSDLINRKLVEKSESPSGATSTSRSTQADSMVLVEGGWFDMGASKGAPDETPVHRVYVDSFLMDRFEVTVAAYKKFCDATGRSMASVLSDNRGVDQPVSNVTWDDAVAYAAWSGKRLPTEAEWEYAARGGKQPTGTMYSGASLPDEVAWYYSNSGARINPVGQKNPNILGLYDMSGNVWEWCLDWYESDAYTRSPDKNPRGPDSGQARVLRGGAWSSELPDLRVTRRIKSAPSASFFDFGFRCAKDASK